MRLRTHIGTYRLHAMIGRGGDAEVWAAKEAITAVPVAIKCPRRDRMPFGPLGLRGRFIREYQYLRQLALPFIPRARGLVEDGEDLALVMDFIEGDPAGAWADVLLEDPSHLPRVLHVLGECARRVLDLHSAGLYHGDLKPSCFLVGPDDTPHLLDLGGARPIDSNLLTHRIGEHFGTPTLAAPELLAFGPPTSATEVFGFAATVFRILTGDVPAGRARRTELLARWTTDPPTDLLSRLQNACPALPHSLAEHIVAALSADPQHRPTLSTLASLFPAHPPRPRSPEPSVPFPSRHEDELSTVLDIASGPLPPRIMATVLGLTPGAVSNRLSRLPHVEHVDASWRLRSPNGSIDPTHGDLAAALATSLAGHPIGLAQIRALAHTSDAEATLAALERWVTALSQRGRLAEAAEVLSSIPSSPSLEARRTLLEARVALARPTLDAALDHRLVLGLRDPLYGKAHLRARWDLARHFGTFHAESPIATLGIGWRALLVCDLDAALTSAVSALDEARWLRQPETEADALLLLALVHGTRGSTSTALTFAAEAVDRWPARTPGIGEAVATLARLELGIGAASEARAHLIEYAPEMPTPIDSLHIRLALAEIELLLGHRAIAIDVVRELYHTESPPCVAHRVLALRLELSEVDIDDALDQFSARLRHGRIYDIAVLGPSLIAALRKSNRSHAEAADCTLTSIQRSGDLRAALRWHAAVGRSPETHETLVELVRRATEENLWPSLMQLGLEHGDELLAWRALKRILPHLSRADQNALTLEPWAVVASRLDTEVH